MDFLNMKIWVDDTRPAPYGYVWCKTVNEAKNIITCVTRMHDNECPDFLPCIHVLDLDHDAGDYAQYGGDYIEILNWLEKQGWSIRIKLHTMNPVGRENMRAIIQKNGWTEVF